MVIDYATTDFKLRAEYDHELSMCRKPDHWLSITKQVYIISAIENAIFADS